MTPAFIKVNRVYGDGSIGEEFVNVNHILAYTDYDAKKGANSQISIHSLYDIYVAETVDEISEQIGDIYNKWFAGLQYATGACK